MSADARSEGVIAIIVPERDYLLKKLCDKEGKIYRFEDKQWQEYQQLLHTNVNVFEIMVEALMDVEEEFCLPEVECVGKAGRFWLTAETFVVGKGA